MRSIRWAIVIPVTLSVVAFGAAVALVFGSKFFAVQRLTVVGVQTIPPDELVHRAWEELWRRRLVFFNSTNRFLYDEARLRSSLEAAYFFEHLDIERVCRWDGTGCEVNITAEERTSQLLWASSDRLYLVDLGGAVIREVAEEEAVAWRDPGAARRLPEFIDLNGMAPTIGQSVLTGEEVTNVLAFHARLSDMGIPFRSTTVDRLAGKWLAVETELGYEILFDATGDIDAQADRLAVVLRDSVPDPSVLDYVDLRFGDHVYFK